MSVWATFVKRTADTPWRLEAVSVMGADRARALAEREHARHSVVGAEFRVRQFSSIKEIPDHLDG